MSRIDTGLPADSTEFCSCAAATDIFAVGTYKLEESYSSPTSLNEGQSERIQRRLGKCLIFQANKDDSESCQPLQEIVMPAVLDMKWASEVLAIADAEGNVRLYNLNLENRQLDEVGIFQCHDGTQAVISLSLDWCRYRSDYSSDKLTVSLSDGSVKILTEVNGTLAVTDTWKAHDFEPWITAWDRWELTRIYTGGDDCVLKGWDSRMGFNQPAFQNKRFDGGVTSIQSSPHLEHIIAAGSYDGRVRIFDVRQPSRPISDINVGGGAWRVKWHPDPTRQHHALVACMHDGFKVIDFKDVGQSAIQDTLARISSRFDRHESLAYGVDWSFAPPTKEGTLIASCSFYDQSLYLWRV